ncbi:cytochrome d ubiquinol oxidase subunit II [Teredinibacter sp. KSP-S5-2]|uniref:cytochrome d ubiquinol oxidase subunit II n=1 Tax=Teredinibacter sp. KSP-S5-2 TaxID=3034506 RepID=UPI002934FE29|nr:cytochrome d ubiquinol oxidase subunit II [Teredinibacter sp. KSP-S5-2]WNO10772.1 cytochrome d ubiquinol oxidase subunit II [Teredinibacter sp. KSP-S5-2]
MLDYEMLKIIWWCLIGVLLIGFAVTDGFDMGAVALIRFVGRTDDERRVVLNTVGPHWDGNQVWFITAGGAIFAAWPIVYAVAFSGLYWALLLVLFALFFRPVGFEYRSKIEDLRWRTAWDWLMTAGSAIPALVFGVAFGNLFLGLPFVLDEYMHSAYEGTFWQLLSPFAVLCGVVSLAMLIMHGGCYLQMRTNGELAQRAVKATMISASVTLVAFVLAGVWVANIKGFVVTEMVDPQLAMSPLDKNVVTADGAWLNNYSAMPLTMLAPISAICALLLTLAFSVFKRAGWAFFFSSVALAGIILTAGLSLFPFIMPSSINPDFSLTLWDVVSSKLTLTVMFWVAVIFVPIVLSYTLWGYVKMWRKLDTDFIENNRLGTY